MIPVVETIDTGSLNWADAVILGIILVSTGISLMRGFFQEAISLATWVIALWVAFTFSAEQASLLDQWIETPSIRTGTAFALLFFAVLIVGSIINKVMQSMVEFSGFSGMDYILGLFFGMARGLIIVSLLILMSGLTPLPQDSWWQESQLIPKVLELSMWVIEHLPEHLRSYFDYGQMV